LTITHSEEAVKYIESYGAKALPVVFRVYYDGSGAPSGAVLVRVAEIEADKILKNERSIGAAMHFVEGDMPKPGETKSYSVRAPADCFDSEQP
jgi:hypothetical protein